MNPLWRLVKGAAVFAAIGPMIGYLAFLLVTFVHKPDPSMFSPALVPMAAFAYILGVVPAAATGAVAGLLEPWIISWRSYLLVGLLGGLASCAFAIATSLANWSAVGALVGLVFFPGLVAGLITARMYFGLPPNNSFKPNPLRGSA